MKNRSAELKRQPLLLKPSQVCAELGIGRTKAYQLFQSGQIQVRRIGRSIRVHRDELERFARSNQEVD